MILLDTHVCLWLLHQPDRIGPQSGDAIRLGPTFVSAVSEAELRVKMMTGRIRLPEDVHDQLLASGVQPLPLRADHATALTRFPALARHDPFDRLLLAQAVVEGLRLLTVDRVLLASGEPSVVDARL